MKIFRRLSTPRLIVLLAAITAAAVAASIGSVAALGSSAQSPAPKPLDQALEEALTTPTPAGVTARVRFTNNLLPSAALSGITGSGTSALMSGGSGRLWWSPDTGGRIELQSDAGDVQILWDKARVRVWDSSSNTVYELPLPSAATAGSVPTDQAPTLADIDTFLKQLAGKASVTDPSPASLAGEPAYLVSVTPAQPAGLIGSLELAWDATHGVPLEIALRAKGQSSPALAFKVTEISFGAVSASDLAVSPPANAKIVDLGGLSKPSPDAPGTQNVTGLAAVRAAIPFTLVAPDTLGGLPRQSVQLLGGADEGALVLYGEGLGGLALVEHAAGSSSGSSQASNLPKVALGAVAGHELATQLGTVVLFERAGVSFMLGGSMPSHTVEAAARELG